MALEVGVDDRWKVLVESLHPHRNVGEHLVPVLPGQGHARVLQPLKKRAERGELEDEAEAKRPVVINRAEDLDNVGVRGDLGLS